MNQQNREKVFQKLFMQIHVLAILFSYLTGLITNLITALFSYLLYIHSLAAIVYIYDIKTFRPDYLFDKFF